MTASDHGMFVLAKAAMDGKAKPPGSLGLLETWAIKLAVLQGTVEPSIAATRLLVFAADHGITLSTPGVSAYPRQVSAAVFSGIAQGGGASAVLCAANNCSLNLVDVGLDADVESICSSSTAPHVTVTHSKIKKGSRSMLSGAAMTAAESQAAQLLGVQAVDRFVMEHNDRKPCELVVCVGELGIGNTTAAAAITAALSRRLPEEVCGRGTGLDDAGLQLKIKAVEKALAVNADLIETGPEGVLQAVGGLEIAAMVGAYMRAAELGMPFIVDGFISGSAALVAFKKDPKIERCLFWSHWSQERGMDALVDIINDTLERKTANGVVSSEAEAGGAGAVGAVPARVVAGPPLHMGMRLGEGTGAVLAVPLLRSAAAVLTNMASLKDVIAAGGAGT